VKVWSVAVVVSEKVVVCVTPEPVALIVTLGVVGVAGAMLAAVEIVMTVVLGFVPSIVTGVGLNAQVAPVGIPVQLGVMGWFSPLTGVNVSVILAELCPATTLVLVGAASIEKSGAITMTTAAAEVEALFVPSPKYLAVTLLLPPGSAVVVRTAVPVAADGRFKSTVPKTVVVLLFTVENWTLPTPVDGVTVAVKVTGLLTWTLVKEGEIATELVVRALDAAQAVNSAFMSTEPRPVTALYLCPPSTEKPKVLVVPVAPGHRSALGSKLGVAPLQGTMSSEVPPVVPLVPVLIS
jgi:hypothetical protein